MMRRVTSLGWGFVVIFLFILIFQECLAGVVIEQVVRDREESPSKVFIYFAESKFRRDHPDKSMTTIVDFREDRMVMIDHRSRQYVEVKFSLWEREVGEQLKKSAPSVKPKSRKIEVKRTGETAILHGFRTEKVQIFADGELIEEHWVTRDVEMREVEKVMERVAVGFSKEFKSEMKEGREIYEKLKPYGYPIVVKDYTITYGLRGIDVLEVTKFEKKELADEVFLPPSGYQRIIPEQPKR